MMFGKKENSGEAVSTDSEQSNIQKKRHESDIEKNILVLEDSIGKLKGDFATAAEIKNIKESLAALSQIKDKLREIEDLELITKLEAIQTQDDVHNLTDGIGSLKTKVDLLSGAIKLISTKITETPKLAGPDTTDGAANIEKMTLSLKSDVDSLKKRLDSGTSGSPKAGPADSACHAEIDVLKKEVTSLKAAVDKAENLEKHIYDLDKKLAGVQLPKESLNKLSSENASGDYLKYVPVIKENISKLYKVYNRTEKRVNDIENNINEIKALKKNPAAPVPSALNEAVKKTVDHELKEVLENINTLTADIRSQIAGEIGEQNTLIDTLKKDYETRIHSLESEIAGAQKKKASAKSYNYEEFAEFRARMLNEINQLRKDTKEFEKRISSGELENIVDNKLTPHVSNQDKIAKSLTLLNRKVEQKHMEVSKNTHEKINTSVKSVMERISQIENDITLLKDMKVDLVDDITAMLDHSGKEKADANISTKKLEEKYDDKLKELAEKIDAIQHESSASTDAEIQDTKALAKGIRSIQYENEILKQELEKIKSLYFEMLQQKEEIPVIIE